MGPIMHRFSIISLILIALSAQALAGPPADPFTVTGIPVQATAQSSVEAQSIAINSGKQRAWAEVYHRLAKQEDWGKQPALDDTALTRLIASYLPNNERRSTTRYSATMTYVFNAGAVRHLLHTQNIAYADENAKPLLVIPMGPTYQSHSVWATVWLNPKFSRGAVPIFLPPSGSDSSLAGLKFSDPDLKVIAPIAAQVHASDAYLALATTANGHVIVKLKRVGLGQSSPVPDVDVTIPAGTTAANAYAAVADNTAVAIANAWKGHSAVDYSRRSRMTADIHIDSLDQWAGLFTKLSTVPNVSDVTVAAMDTGEARIVVSYIGNLDQLHDNITKSGFDMTSNDSGIWTIAQSSSTDDSTPSASPQ
jgi:hypothetical protein